MDIDIRAFNVEAVRQLAQALQQVLDSRTHKRIYLGDEIRVKGSLSKALKLPEIIRTLNSPHHERQIKAQDAIAELWATLSPSTQEHTLEKLNWYEPNALDWEDPRSNRRPSLGASKSTNPG